MKNKNKPIKEYKYASEVPSSRAFDHGDIVKVGEKLYSLEPFTFSARHISESRKNLKKPHYQAARLRAEWVEITEGRYSPPRSLTIAIPQIESPLRRIIPEVNNDIQREAEATPVKDTREDDLLFNLEITTPRGLYELDTEELEEGLSDLELEYNPSPIVGVRSPRYWQQRLQLENDKNREK